MLKLVNKPKNTESVFTTYEIIFNGKKMPNILDIFHFIEIKAIIAKKPKTFIKKNKK